MESTTTLNNVPTESDYFATSPKPALEQDMPLESLGKLFKDSLLFTWQKKWRFVYLAFMPGILSFLPWIIVFLLYAILHLLLGSSESAHIVLNIINLILGLLGVSAVFFALIYGLSWSQASMIYYLRTNESSKKVILKNSFKYALGLFWIKLIRGFIVFFGLILFIIPGLIWAVKYSFAHFAYLLQDHKGMKALTSSAELIHGYRWPVFKRFILFAYFQFLIRLVWGLLFILIFLLWSINHSFLIIAIILFILVALLNILINLLMPALANVYNFDIYQNLSSNKNQNRNSTEKHGFGYKLWCLVLIFIVPIIFIVLMGLAIMNPQQTLVNQVSKFLPEGLELSSDNINIDNKETNSLVNPFDQDQISARDAQRFYDITMLEYNLGSYYQSNNSYPISVTPLVLGKDNAVCLDVKQKSFKVKGECLGEYSKDWFSVAANPEPGGSDYLYSSPDGQNYQIEFTLESDTGGYNAGKHFVTKDGIDVESNTDDNNNNLDEIMPEVDTDSDGLTDFEERLYGTDANNPDTDADGYKDGQELKNGYDPLIPGNARLKY